MSRWVNVRTITVKELCFACITRGEAIVTPACRSRIVGASTYGLRTPACKSLMIAAVTQPPWPVTKTQFLYHSRRAGPPCGQPPWPVKQACSYTKTPFLFHSRKAGPPCGLWACSRHALALPKFMQRLTIVPCTLRSVLMNDRQTLS